MPRRALQGFSLVELLVAMVIVAIVGGAVFHLLLSSFRLYGQGVSATGAVEAADVFDLAFSRDFASAFAPLGFEGDGYSCRFWTFRPAANGAELSRVRWTLAPRGALEERWPLGAEEGDRPTSTNAYPTRLFRSFSYWGTNAPSGEWGTAWSSTNGAPALLRIQLAAREENGAPAPWREYIRRTAP